MLRLIVNPANATTGEAVDKLMTIPRNGMARSASPKPTAERMKAQRKRIGAVTIMSVVVSTEDIDSMCAVSCWARLVLRTANSPASLAGCSPAYQARLPHVEPAAYLLRTVLSFWHRP